MSSSWGRAAVALTADKVGWRRPAVPVFLMLGVVAALFCPPTVEMRGERPLRCFGPGLIRRSFSRRKIVGAKRVRNEWHYGWGLRFTAFGWLFSVSGLDAVELLRDAGQRVRIGTDEPGQLADAIRRLIRG
jgi:hypothetical protein